MSDTLTPKVDDVVINKPRTMDFPDAMREIKKGSRVARVSWGNSDYCVLDGEWLSIFTKGSMHVWKVNDGDILGEDWVVVGETN